MCTSPPEPLGVRIARQHAKGSVQVARPAQRSANLRSWLDVAHDTGARWRSREHRTCAVRALLPSVHDGTAVGPAPTPGFRTARRPAPCAPSDASQRPQGLTLWRSSTGHGVLVPAPADQPSLPGTRGSRRPTRIQRRRWAGAIGMSANGPYGWSCIDDDPNSVHRARIRARALASCR
jgi:hypothetical protein